MEGETAKRRAGEFDDEDEEDIALDTAMLGFVKGGLDPTQAMIIPGQQQAPPTNKGNPEDPYKTQKWGS